MIAVDVDDPSTWPAPVREWVTERADAHRGTTEYTSDLKIYEDQDLLGLLQGHLLRAYHCTRLLDHERTMILDQGLRPLNAELVTERIRRAHEADAITDRERQAFEAGHQFVIKGWEERVRITERQVCLVFSSKIFDEHVHGIEPFLSTWGGEAIYFGVDAEFGEASEHGKRIRTIGRPSIVVADVDLSARPFGAEHYIAPSLGACFVGIHLGLKDAGAEIFYRAPVPAANIVDIWHPGAPGYDRHVRLPQR